MSYMFFLGAATDVQTISDWVLNILPFQQLVTMVDNSLPAFNLIALFIIVVGALFEIPKGQGENILNVVMRAVVAMAAICSMTNVLWVSEVFAQSLTQYLASNGPANYNWFIQNPQPGGTTLLSTPDAKTRAEILYSFRDPFTQLAYVVVNLSTSPATGQNNGNSGTGQNNNPAFNIPVLGGLLRAGSNAPGIQGAANVAADANIGNDIDTALKDLVIGNLALIACLCVFIMTLALVIQKGILVFGRLLLPPFIGLLTWQGPSRFLGINYIQSMMCVIAWPIGWGLVNVGTMAGLQNLHKLNWSGGFLDYVVIWINAFLIIVWMITGTVMAPALITRVITAGGNFASAMMGAVSGKIVGAAGSAVQGAMETAGVAAGAVGGPTGMSIGGSIGRGAGGAAASPFSHAGNAIAQATGEGGGGQGPSVYPSMAAYDMLKAQTPSGQGMGMAA